LTPALVNYPITVVNKIATLKPPKATPDWSGKIKPTNVLVDTVNHPLVFPAPKDYENDLETTWELHLTMGALYNSLDKMFGMATVYNGEESTYTTTGAYTSTYEDQSSGNPRDAEYQECASSWLDPLPDIALQVREFMFRTAVSLAARNISSQLRQPGETFDFKYETYKHSVATESVTTHIVTRYKTNRTFLWIGVGLMISAALTSIPLFYGYWRLGRSVSLSPLEMANAIDARNVFATSETNVGGSNAETKELLKQFGGRKLKYGEVSPNVLGFSAVDHVHEPRKGQVYV
jgi:hypothetical protein